MKLVSMKRTAPSGSENAATPTAMADAPDYPWGLCLNLSDDELDKLGIDGLLDVGSTLQLSAIATVTNVSSQQAADGDERRGVTLQITDMGLSGKKKSAASALYGKDDE